MSDAPACWYLAPASLPTAPPAYVQQGPTTPDFGAYWHGYVEAMRDQIGGDLWIALVGFAYFVLMLRWKGATLGKLALGLRVRLRERDGRLPWTSIALRVGVANGIACLATLSVLTGSLGLTVLVPRHDRAGPSRLAVAPVGRQAPGAPRQGRAHQRRDDPLTQAVAGSGAVRRAGVLRRQATSTSPRLSVTAGPVSSAP